MVSDNDRTNGIGGGSNGDPLFHQKLRAAQALAHLAEGRYSESARGFASVSPELTNQFCTVISAEDLAMYGSLLGLATMDRGMLHELVIDGVFKGRLEVRDYDDDDDDDTVAMDMLLLFFAVFRYMHMVHFSFFLLINFPILCLCRIQTITQNSSCPPCAKPYATTPAPNTANASPSSKIPSDATSCSTCTSTPTSPSFST